MIRNVCKWLLLGFVLNVVVFENYVHATSPYTCQRIKTNYINAVKQFLSVVETLRNNKEYRRHKSIKDALDAAVTTISVQQNYSHPSLSSSYSGIEKAFNEHFKSKDVNDILDGLNSQLESTKHKVGFWKEPHGSLDRCRAKCECDLGEKGTDCGVDGRLKAGQACADFKPKLN